VLGKEDWERRVEMLTHNLWIIRRITSYFCILADLLGFRCPPLEQLGRLINRGELRKIFFLGVCGQETTKGGCAVFSGPSPSLSQCFIMVKDSLGKWLIKCQPPCVTLFIYLFCGTGV
jgi:hypothetical protein